MNDETAQSHDARSLFGSPRLTAFAPLLYVAWSDGQLSERESEGLGGRLAHLDADERAVLEPWLDPDAPPTSTELFRLLRMIRERVARLPTKNRAGLVQLGMELGEATPSEAEATALRELEGVLGLDRVDGMSFFAPRPGSEQTFDEDEASFDVHALRRELDGDYAEDWEKIRALITDERLDLRQGLSTHAYRDLVFRWLQVVAGEGVGLLSFPTAIGGQGRVDRFVKCFEALSMHDLNLVVKMGVQFGLFGGAVMNLGTESHHDRFLPAIARCELLGGFAMTELGHGSNVRELETVARFDVERDAFVLHTPSLTARKEWIGNAALHGRAMVVFAQLETPCEDEPGRYEGHGVHAFFVRVRDDEGALLPGVLVEDCGHKMGLNGVDNGRLWFDHVLVPREDLLDRYGQVDARGRYSSPIASASKRFFTMLGTLVGGRVSVAPGAVSAAKVALATAVRYGALRRQFGAQGQPEQVLLDYPAHQLSLIPKVAHTYALHFAVANLQQQFSRFATANARGQEAEQEEGTMDGRALEGLAAGIKALSTWHAIDATQAARERCGGMGYLTVNRIAQMRRDVDVFATFEGDNVVLMQLVAKGLLSGFARELADDLFATVLTQIGERAKRAIAEQNPLTRRKTDDEHLRSAEFHADTLHYRTQHLLVSAARRFKKRVDEGMDPFAAATDIQDHLLALSRAHMEEEVARAFRAGVEGCEDEALRLVLEKLRALHAMDIIHRDAAWFLENDYFERSKSRALRKAHAALCRELRNDAVPLVDAFGVPDAMLGPIAFEQYSEHALLARRDDAGGD